MGFFKDCAVLALTAAGATALVVVTGGTCVRRQQERSKQIMVRLCDCLPYLVGLLNSFCYGANKKSGYR